MAAVVNAKFASSLTLTRVLTLVSGVETRVGATIPYQGAVIEFSSSTTPAVTKAGIGTLALTASTPVTVDLTAIATTITNWAGDNSFSTVFGFAVANGETAGTGKKATMGAAAGTVFDFGLAGTTPTIDIPAGTTFELWTKETAGWTTSSKNSLKFNPGSNNVTLTIIIVGS